MIISGIPPTKEENVIGIVKEVATELGIALREFDIIAAHRLPAKVRVPDIIVKLFCNEVKTEMIKRAKKNRLSIRGVPIYVSEHLLA